MSYNYIFKRKTINTKHYKEAIPKTLNFLKFIFLDN